MEDDEPVNYDTDEIDAKLTEALSSRPVFHVSMIKKYSECKAEGEGDGPFRRIPEDILPIIRSNRYVIPATVWLQFSKKTGTPLRGAPEHYGIYEDERHEEEGMEMIRYKFNDSKDTYVPAKDVSFSLAEAKEFIVDNLIICVLSKDGVVRDFFYMY